MQLNTRDLVNTSTGPLGNFVPEVKIVDISFLLRDYDHARKVVGGVLRVVHMLLIFRGYIFELAFATDAHFDAMASALL